MPPERHRCNAETSAALIAESTQEKIPVIPMQATGLQAGGTCSLMKRPFSETILSLLGLVSAPLHINRLYFVDGQWLIESEGTKYC